MSSPRFICALWAGKLCACFARLFFPKRGSNLPGEIALKIDRNFLRHVRGIDFDKAIFITGTNGKSTSNNLIVHTLLTAGYSVASNLEGANMKPGAAAALVKFTGASGRFKCDYLTLEVDERSLPAVLEALPAKNLCVTNLQKDQVQRNGDPDFIYQKIKSAIRPDMTLFVNDDEPRSKSLAKFGARSVSFGVSKDAGIRSADAELGVTMPCPVCGDALTFDNYTLSYVGAFRCPSCGFSGGENADYTISGVDTDSFIIRGERFHMEYSAAHFLYNYILCYAVCSEVGVAPEIIGRAFETFRNIGGRFEIFPYAGKTLCYMRIKQENPETLQSALDVMAADRAKKVFLFGPAVVDDIVPHYTNTFYAFDCNFAPFAESGVERCICFGKTICFDAANRLRYAGVPESRITILNTDDEAEIMNALASCNTKNIYLITWLKKYESMRAYAERANL
jgi:UDP-N-acetylmuramyl tripeptide synthase